MWLRQDAEASAYGCLQVLQTADLMTVLEALFLEHAAFCVCGRGELPAPEVGLASRPTARVVKHTATSASTCSAHSYGLVGAGTMALMSTRQWLQQELGGLKLARSEDSQNEGDKYSQGPETVATWNVIGSIQEHMQDEDDMRLLHPPLSQDWKLDASTNEGTVTSFIHGVTRCLSSLCSCQMLARCSNVLVQSPC